MNFSFRRARFHFLALDPLRLPRGKAANVIRGAFGLALHETAPASEYERLFKPHAVSGPSGLADAPRPFVFRCSSLEGLQLPTSGSFAFDVHFFDLNDDAVLRFEAAFRAWEFIGLGVNRARVRLNGVEIFDPHILSLEPDWADPGRVAVRFVTPTELKSDGVIFRRPDFPVLFARIRDRIATLRALYGLGPLPIDFGGLGERATAIHTVRSDIHWEHRERRSGTTRLIHPLGGFTGHVEYAGSLAEFLPWLRAAQFAGVGRQTVWGKGELQVIS